MAWLRIDDRVRTHPKIVKAGPSAAWFWFCGICYCREHLTDGFIQREMLPTLVPGESKWKRLASLLVTVGLWHDAEGGYQVHDFLDWNPARATVLAQRKKDLDRKQGKSATDSTKDSRQDSERIPSGFQREPSRDRAGDAGLGSSGSGSGDPREERVTLSRFPIIKKRNLSAFWEGSIFDVPDAWARKLLTAANGTTTEDDIRAFARQTTAAMEAAKEPVDDSIHLFAWLDAKWRDYRKARDVADADARHERVLQETADRQARMDAEPKSTKPFRDCVTFRPRVDAGEPA